MNNLPSRAPLSDHFSPGLSLFVTLLIVFGGVLFIGPILGILVIIPFTGGSLETIMDLASYNRLEDSFKIPTLLLQGMSSIGAFIIPAFIVVQLIFKNRFVSLFHTHRAYLAPMVLTIVITVSFMAVNSFFIQWNQNIQLPDFLGFREWATNTEELLARVTSWMTTFNSPMEFMLAFVVIAILPAIGEELLFRGVLQTQCQALFKNHHAAIWVTAFLFGFFHLQFYGLVPRMLLGAMLGYLYVWSGNLWYPILGHFINNGLALLAAYLYQLDATSFDFESQDAAPLPQLIGAAVLVIVLSFVFVKYFRRGENPVYE